MFVRRSNSSYNIVIVVIVCNTVVWRTSLPGGTDLFINIELNGMGLNFIRIKI